MACLYLVPNTLDHGCEPGDLQAVLPRSVIAQAALLEHWIVEDAKSARAFLKRVQAIEPSDRPIQALDIRELPRPIKGAGGGTGVGGAGAAAHRGSAESVWAALLQPLASGADMGLLSEAGLPGVADPGSEAVARAHHLGARVIPLSGPNSMVLALAASGLHGQSFAFVGYLPQDPAQRAARLRELQARSRREHQTQLLIETPYRNEAIMRALLDHLDPQTRVSVSAGLTLPQGWSRTLTVAQWRQSPPRFDKGTPAVFAFLA